MAQGIAEIRDRAAQIIRATVPDVEPRIRFVEAPSTHGELSALQPGPSPSENTRQFHCLPGDLLGGGQWSGPDVELVQSLTVDIRYDVGLFDDWYKRLRIMAASDQARITASLERPSLTVNWSGVDCFGNCRFMSAGPLTRAPQFERIWVRRLTFRMTYILLEN